MTFSVVRLAEPADLPAVRELMVRTIERDYGYPFQTRFHADVDDLAGYYLDAPRHALLVALEGPTVVGCAAVRPLGITSPPHPASLLERYDRARTAELTRVFVDPSQRRHGVGRALVDAALTWIAAEGGYAIAQLHSRTAVEFWQATGAREVADTRDGSGGPSGGQVYFELELPRLTA